MIAAVGMGFGRSGEQGNEFIVAVKEVAEASRKDKQEERDKKQEQMQDIADEMKCLPPGQGMPSHPPALRSISEGAYQAGQDRFSTQAQVS